MNSATRTVPGIVLALATAMGAPGESAQGQRLLELGPLIADSAVAEPAAMRYAVQLNVDLIRSAPERLELPAPDGRLQVAELSVFEDRGDGDAMWAGRIAGASYESVVLTVVGGHLAGLFGVPGGPKYRVSGQPDGQGQIEDLSTLAAESRGQYCTGGIAPDLPLPQAAVEAQRTADPEAAIQASNHNRLDIMILYSEAARRVAGTRPGGAQALSRGVVDHLNMVFRNGQLDVVARLVHWQQVPVSLDTNGSGVLGRLGLNQEVRELRSEHNADLVHLFVTSSEGTDACGRHHQLTKGHTPKTFSPSGYGLTDITCLYEMVFAHEIGHGLGASHDPANAEYFYERRHSLAVQPYAFGDSTRLRTVMSVGPGEWVPWFSTVRVEPYGRAIGIANERENERAIRGTIGILVRLSDFLDQGPSGPPPGTGPIAPGNLTGVSTGPASVRLSWVDRSRDETGFEVQVRQRGSGWRTDSTLPANSTTADVTRLTPGARYDFRVRSFHARGASASNTVTISLPPAEYTDCVPTEAQITFAHGYTVSMCVEYLEGGIGPIVKEDAWNYGLDSRESGILYFFDRDNAEVLVKVLDACAVNGFRWVFVAPVTDLAFNLYVEETATGKGWMHRNPKGGVTATTASDVTAFPCSTAAARAMAGDADRGVELVDAGSVPASVDQALSGGESSDCRPQPVVTLSGGYEVRMCVEYVRDGETLTAEVKDYGLDSEQSGLLYFFERSNAEVLIKVLDGCGVNGHRWVFVAPVTDLAFNLVVESPHGQRWTHRNRLGRTADAASATSAFPCTASS